MKFFYYILFLICSLVTARVTAQTITGPGSMCNSAAVTLSGTPAGGTWSTSNPAVAVVGSGGNVTALVTGTVTISYTTMSGTAVHVMTINPQPSTVSGSSTLCSGYTTTLSSSPIGGTWTSSGAGTGVIDPSGVVMGIAAGSVYTTYTLPGGCASYKTVDVFTAPGVITGSSFICSSSTTTMTNSAIGGTWTSANSTIAIIGSSTGIITGLTAGTTNITYLMPGGCLTAKNVTVNTVAPAITGSSAVCTGTSSTLANVATGGVWSSSAPAIVNVGTGNGIVTGISAGTASITYTLASGCFAQTVVTVFPAPAAITGSATVCLGNVTTYSNAVSGGTWSSINSSVVSIGLSTGLANAVAVDTTTIVYTVGGATGCSINKLITVVTGPSPIVGPSTLCSGNSTTMSSVTPGGSWTCSNPAVLSISTVSGIASAVSAGVAVVTYWIGSCYDTKTVTVNVSPSAIAGLTAICDGGVSTLSNTVTGGTWSSSAPAVATIAGSGLVSTISPGLTTISYTLSSGCAANTLVTVNEAPVAITGPSRVCQGAYMVLSDATVGGLWSSGDPTIASVTTIAFTGTVIGMLPGTATISYTLYTGCFDTFVVTVDPLPAVAVSATAASCGATYVAIATGADDYTWSPATGLSCTSCTSTLVDLTATTIYTVTGTDINGCANSAIVTVNGNRISGHISFSAAMPAASTTKIWLRQINASDSSLVEIDSTFACLDGGLLYYEFAGRATGKYILEARLVTSLPGTSGYIPTYGSSTPYWNSASVISHTAITDTQHIQIKYANTPTGPAVIRGYVGTATAPAAGMLVFLRDGATGEIVSHAYTDGTGAYSFVGIAYGNYTVYPQEFRYYTTPSELVTLSETNILDTLSFKKDSVTRRIYPFKFTTGVHQIVAGDILTVFPNPAQDLLYLSWIQSIGEASVVIRDIAGRIVFEQAINMSSPGQSAIDVQQLQPGMYYLSVRTNDVNYNSKLTIQH